MNRSGRFAVPLLKFGPQLIPQPGALFRRAAFHDVGELNPNYKFAFDLDLLTRLTKVGQFFYTPHHLSTFRWHSGSLTVSNREQSVSESKIIRKLRLPKPLRPISETWEYPIGKLIFWAGTIITAINRLKN
jgi:hypothetical protein